MRNLRFTLRSFMVVTMTSALSLTPFRGYAQEPGQTLVFSFDFALGSQGWLPDFTDYTLESADIDRVAEIRPIPDLLRLRNSGYYLKANNHPDDLFMYLKKPLTVRDGVQPKQAYDITFEVEFASNSRENCPGVGGAEDAVWLKLGASTVEPMPLVNATGHASGYVSINIDKGDQIQSGYDAQSVGSIGNGISCPNPPRYILLRRSLHFLHSVIADGSGTVWILVGTESGYESVTGVYYTSVKVTLKPVS